LFLKESLARFGLFWAGWLVVAGRQAGGQAGLELRVVDVEVRVKEVVTKGLDDEIGLSCWYKALKVREFY
jgi:hypothetical protein